MAWLPLDPTLLRVGLYVKLDHSWMEHPFLRNTFAISSPSEIAIILKQGLSKLYFDPDLSTAAAQGSSLNPASEPSVQLTLETMRSIESDEEALKKRKDAHIRAVRALDDARDTAERMFVETAKRSSEMLDMLNAGRAEGMQLAAQLVDSTMDQLWQPSLALSFAQIEVAEYPGQELAAKALNASLLALKTGVSLNLNQAELRHLGMGALFYNVGMHKLSPSVWTTGRRPSRAQFEQLRQYPQLGKQILEALPGMAPEIAQIVYQHRECLDGSGYPNGLVNGSIGQLARIVGTIAEYNELTRPHNGSHSLSPAQALSYLYVKRKDKLGLDVMEPFIASMTVYPPGSFVELSDGSTGFVMQIHAENRMRPVVMLCDQDTAHKDRFVIDLAKERMLSIRKGLALNAIPPGTEDVWSPTRISGHAFIPEFA